MVQSGELKTSVKMRVAIIAIAILMLGSTVALYMGIVLGYNNSSSDSQAAGETSEKEQRLSELYGQKQSELAASMSAKYFDSFKGYSTRPRSYNAADITDIKVTDLKVGTGTEITEGFTSYMAYYIGWLPDETVFDNSFNDITNPTALKIPIMGSGLIEGWSQGVVGMKIGGVREIEIPAELGYGSEGSGLIPADSPLKFVVMAVEPEEVEWTDEMNKLYAEVYGSATQ